MNGLLTVTVVEFGDRRHYQMQWRDPITGRKKTKSTGIERTGEPKARKDAEKAAAQFEAELREGRYHEPLRVTWGDFRERYETEVLPGLADGTEQKVASTFNWVERVLSPSRLAGVTESRVSYLQAAMRREGLAESTIKTHLAQLAAALRWAERMGMLVKAPRILPPKRAKEGKMMKGRPIVAEEFDRMLAAIPKVLQSRTRGKKPLPPDPAAVASWEHLLRGLWLSGLRLSEALQLWWDRDDKLCVELSGKHPMLRIPAACEKGNQDRLLPMAPEFAEHLLSIPEAERTGPVFKPAARRVHGERLGWQVVSAIVCRIGKTAGVKVASKWEVDANTGERKEIVKYASAHDLRRSFGERWSTRVMPTVLQALMRHESIETTLRYYVGRNAQNMARVLWEAHEKAVSGNTSGNSRHNAPEAATVPSNVNPESPEG